MLAEQTAGKVHGVKQVINTLRTSTGQWLEEESRINDTLLLNGFENVSVRVIGPEAYLSGQVTTESDKQRAVTVIQSVSNLQVVNFLRVVPGPMFSTPILLIAALCGALGPKSNCRNDQLAPELPMSAAAVWVCR